MVGIENFWQVGRIIKSNPAHQGTPLDGIWSYSVGSAYLAKGISALPAMNSVNCKRLPTLLADEYRVGATPASAVLKLAAFGLEGEVLMAQGDVQARSGPSKRALP